MQQPILSDNNYLAACTLASSRLLALSMFQYQLHLQHPLFHKHIKTRKCLPLPTSS